MNESDIIIDTAELKALLDGAGEAVITVTGSSMSPLLRDGKDRVLLKKYMPGTVKKNQIVFYETASGHPVLHRVIKIDSEGKITANGDALLRTEIIEEKQIFAVVACIYKADRDRPISDKTLEFYGSLWNCTRPLRPLMHKIYNVFR